LDGLRLERDGRRVERLGAQKAAALLAYLAHRPSRIYPRDELVELFWPDVELDAGRNNLSTALWTVRRVLESELGVAPADVIRADRTSLRLEPDSVVTDVAEFEAALAAARRFGQQPGGREQREERLARAVALYRGEFLRGFTEGWVYPEQARLRGLFVRAVSELADLLAERGEFHAAIECAGKALACDPLDQDACRRLMRLYARIAQPGIALELFRDLEKCLREGPEIEPSPDLKELAAKIERERGGSRTLRGPVDPRKDPGPAGGGALPPGSPYYVPRAADLEFDRAVAERQTVVLLRGARQSGKTSLLARGLQQARVQGTLAVFSDLQALGSAQLESADAAMRSLAQDLADQLGVDVSPRAAWDPDRGPARNLRQFLRREVLERREEPLVWAIDETDRLFDRPFAVDVFGLFRSWHNERALDPTAPWDRLTLVLAHAAEGHLFITDLSQSPFNVGLRIALEDFTPTETADLNRRYGSPLAGAGDQARLAALVGGHPYLAHRAIHALSREETTLPELEADDAPLFREHLRRLGLLLDRHPDLRRAVGEVLAGRPCPGEDLFLRLRSVGLLVGEGPKKARLRCGLYQRFLSG
jgi:DNA-binding SARP family transcriptional activator